MRNCDRLPHLNSRSISGRLFSFSEYWLATFVLQLICLPTLRAAAAEWNPGVRVGGGRVRCTCLHFFDDEPKDVGIVIRPANFDPDDELAYTRKRGELDPGAVANGRIWNQPAQYSRASGPTLPPG
jgi:hypothetical protein